MTINFLILVLWIKQKGGIIVADRRPNFCCLDGDKSDRHVSNTNPALPVAGKQGLQRIKIK